MRYDVDEALSFGDLDECPQHTEGGGLRAWTAVIHAAKHPCHLRMVGYTGTLPVNHPEYLMAQRGSHLALNMIDPPQPLFRLECFVRALDFIAEHHRAGRVLVHCNNGASRAPSIALLWLSKRRAVLPDDSYAAARAVFETMIPPNTYAPGRGIETFLTTHWKEVA